jgi:hypothetical protein
MSRRKIPASAIKDLQRVLGDAPERRPSEFSQKEAVRVLFPEIRAMQAKGYSVAEIAQVLSERGVEVRASSLRTLLSIFGCAADKKPMRKASRDTKDAGEPGGTATVNRPADSPKKSPERATGRPESSAGPLSREKAASAGLGTLVPAGAAESSKRSSVSSAPARIPRPGTFIPPEDTDKL